VHKEYGVNPTISQCILCGEEKNEIVLLGAAYKDEAPMRMVTSIEPCDKCKDKYLSDGVMLIEAEGNKDKPMPTGRVIVIKDEAYNRTFDVPIHKNKAAYVEPAVFNAIHQAMEGTV